MKKPCSEMFCLRNQDITDAKAFFYLFFMSNSGYFNLFKFNTFVSCHLYLDLLAGNLHQIPAHLTEMATTKRIIVY